jgi:L-cysteine desulfidase
MNGCSLPVVTTSGSGNQGMTCSLPVIKFCEEKNLSHEELIRGLFFSHMTTIHIKTNIGRLSAYCGAICASAGVSGAISFLSGLSLPQIKYAIETTLGTLSGVICDGAKSSCATKIASGISAAFDGYYAASKNRKFEFGEGIVGRDIESTIKNVGTLGQDGMKVTDEVILDIMVKNV